MKTKGLFWVLDRVLVVLCTVTVLIIVAFVLLQVFSRYVLQLPIHGIEELARLVFVWACFCGAALATLRQENIAVTFLAEKTSHTAQHWIGLGVALVVAAVGGIMTLKGTTYVIDKWVYPDYNIALLYPRSLFWLPVPFAGVIMLAKSLSLIFQHLRSLAKR
ncbi:MAG: TRAP transporter small permease subunit [Spirochaetales bacterium]|nr:TRAP transporter small permease subunit [Spirochaetales bacterium]